MTDTTSAPADFIADADEELVFDEIETPSSTTVIAPAPKTATNPKASRSGRPPRRGRAIVSEAEEPEAGPATSNAEVMNSTARSLPEPVLSQLEGAEPNRLDRTQTLLLGIVLFALLTSLLSLGGLIAVGRTLADADADRARAEDERAAIMRIPAIVKTLDTASARLAEAITHTPPSPLNADDLRHGLDDLRLALSNRQPDGLTPLAGSIHDGFSDLGVRMDRLSEQLNRLSRAPSASRTARP